MFAIIKTGGKQYKVSDGSKIKVEKINAKPGEIIDIKSVLLKGDGEKMSIGEPYIKDGLVQARVLEEGRDKKKIVFRYHSKTRYRKKKGHRQHYTVLEIIKIK